MTQRIRQCPGSRSGDWEPPRCITPRRLSGSRRPSPANKRLGGKLCEEFPATIGFAFRRNWERIGLGGPERNTRLRLRPSAAAHIVRAARLPKQTKLRSNVERSHLVRSLLVGLTGA